MACITLEGKMMWNVDKMYKIVILSPFHMEFGYSNNYIITESKFNLIIIIIVKLITD